MCAHSKPPKILGGPEKKGGNFHYPLKHWFGNNRFLTFFLKGRETPWVGNQGMRSCCCPFEHFFCCPGNTPTPFRTNIHDIIMI